MPPWLPILFFLTSRTPAPLSVKVQEPGADRPVAKGLMLELGPEVVFVEQISNAAVRVIVAADGRSLVVSDAAGQPLVSREVRTPGPAATRVFVAIAAQTVRRYRAARAGPSPSPPPVVPPAPPVVTASTAHALRPSTPSPPSVSVASLPPARTATAAPSSPPTLRRWRFETSLDARLWPDPATARVGVSLAVARRLGRVHIGARARAAYGPAVTTAQLQGRFAAVHGLAEVSLDLRAASGELDVSLGAGLGVLAGSVAARAPTFADPGTPRSVQLLEPVLWPRLAFATALGDDVSVFAEASLKVALSTHDIELPQEFAATTEAPLRTSRLQPGLSFGVRWVSDMGREKD